MHPEYIIPCLPSYNRGPSALVCFVHGTSWQLTLKTDETTSTGPTPDIVAFAIRSVAQSPGLTLDLIFEIINRTCQSVILNLLRFQMDENLLSEETCKKYRGQCAYFVLDISSKRWRSKESFSPSPLMWWLFAFQDRSSFCVAREREREGRRGRQRKIAAFNGPETT